MQTEQLVNSLPLGQGSAPEESSVGCEEMRFYARMLSLSLQRRLKVLASANSELPDSVFQYLIVNTGLH